MRTHSCIAAMAAVALLGSVSTASAADLGGDCCADLEERIAELEATTVRKGNRKVSLTIYGQVNQAVMFWDDTQERNAYVVNNKTSTSSFGFEGAATISPEWRAGYLIELEVAAANSDFVDQGVVSGLFPERDPVTGLPTGINIVADVTGFGDESRSGLIIRQSNWWLESKRLGRVTVGQQSNATDNIAEMDLSRTSVVSLSSVETWNEGFFLVSANDGLAVVTPGLVFLGNGVFQGFSIVGDLWRGNFDGGRGNFVRYDTPVLNGFILSASWGEDDDWAVGLRYAGSFNGISVKAGIGYQDGKTLDTDSLTFLVGGANAIPDHREVVGSASVLHEPSGAFLTLAGGRREFDSVNVSIAPLGFAGSARVDSTEEKFIYVKGGLLRNWVPLGQTAIYGEYYRIWDVGIEFNGADPFSAFFAGANPRLSEAANTLGLGVVQHIDSAAMEVYFAYRHYWADDITDIGLIATGPGTALPSLTDHDLRMDVFMTGARIKF